MVSVCSNLDLAASVRQLWSCFYRLSSQERNSASVGSQNRAQPLHICVVLPPSAFGSAVKRSGRDETLLGCSFQASLPNLVFFFHFSSLLLVCAVFLISNQHFYMYSVHVSVSALWFEWVCKNCLPFLEFTRCPNQALQLYAVVMRQYPA